MSKTILITGAASPFKGDTHYWTPAAEPGDHVACSYAAPYLQVAAIAGHIVFHQDEVVVVLGPKGDR